MTAFKILKSPNRRLFLKSAIASLFLPVFPAVGQELKIKKSTKLIAEAAGLSGTKSIVVMDALTGEVLESYKGSKPMPPASVAKVGTTLYALSALGAAATFKTRLIATGSIESGVLNGDLILEGAGDPGLDTDGLGSLAEQLKVRGVKAVRGKFYVYAGALPYQRQIDPEQPDYVGYNPTIHGINLNYNRVYFQWKRGAAGYILSLLAQARKYAPEVLSVKIALGNRNFPVFTYRSVNGLDHWSVAKSALGKSGSRWLPVRQPADYAGEVFRSVAAYNGVRMPKHEVTEQSVTGTEVAAWESRDIQATVKSMIKYSTNITAETLGMNATIKRGETAGTLRQSAKVMNKWLEAQYGVRGAKFVDHSGLGSDSRISGHEIARLLVNAKWDGPLRPLMKEITLRNSKGKKSPISGTKMVVKTGTLNFASALAGYVTCPNGRKLVFAVFTADLKERAKIAKKDRERPPGTRRWVRNSRAMQHQLVRHWVQSYGT